MTERGRKNCNYANNVISPQTEQHVCVLGMLPLVPQNYGCQEQGAENFKNREWIKRRKVFRI